MNFSWPFIRRPIGTTLMAIGLFMVGAVAYAFLPVASLPSVDLPTIAVMANRPGADPNIMAATVAAPLERRLGEIAGVTELTSVSSLGSSRLIVQFDLSRSVDGAARDVQAALNAALSDLPGDMPTLPTFRKFNPAAAPILILALTSKTMQGSAIYDAADSVIAQRLSQVQGVADVTVAGSEQPALRVRVDPTRLASIGVSLEDVRNAISNANAMGPLGSFDGKARTTSIGINDQLTTAPDYDALVVKTVNGNVIRLPDIASIKPGVRNSLSAGWYNRSPSVLLIITKQGDANVIDTVDRIYALLPELRQWVPAGLDISVLTDRTQTIRASVRDMQLTLAATIVLVMMVVYLFLRRTPPTIAAGITVPLSLAGTCGAMWLAGFSIDNLSLMALVVSVGFVVDDAIVMIENVFRNIEAGMSPIRATLKGAKQIGFTVVSISVSLIAAFIPLLFMGGIVGRFFREFSVTLAFAIAVSTVVSLSVTPMICAYFVRQGPSPDATWLDRLVERALSWLTRFYDRTLSFTIQHRAAALIVFVATIALTAGLFIKVPKGYFPQDDTGLIFGGTSASTDISFEAMEKLQQQATDIVLSDPAVASVGSSVGASGFNASVNHGRLFISLKPLAERHNVPTQQVINRMRNKLNHIPGIRVFMVAAQDIRAGGRQSDSQYQFTLWSSDIDQLQAWVPKVLARVKQIPGIVDVTTDREQGGLQAMVDIDRQAAARLGVKIQDIDNALNDAFSQRQISTIYGTRNQYRVILEVDRHYQRDPNDLSNIYLPGKGGASVPLSAVAKVERTIAPLVVNHQGQFPSTTITYNLAPGTTIQEGTAAITQAVADMHIPDVIHTDFAGDVQQFKQSAGAQPLLLLTALIAVYIVLGVLYESLAHPLTIISTLPSAGLGALLALEVSGTELTVIAFIGIILLIGIVKKNGIMMVDFALDGERRRGLSPERAIHEACLERFRPILMTTMAAMLGALPLVIASGPGSELRRPLGITIIGGLLVSQVLTLYTTPVIYLLLDRLHRRLGGARPTFIRRPPPAPQPAE
ncbi:MAG TPA: efflux RND transporter permease subunit [Pseudolabrys sp.]|uniref:efflux RND transporter permease subunit n=1 Tax=Pseudolabrys sp. TaxID=1960880 RepID=UPI002DDD2547|nr:efflux RND transporter permease subunit [Pseudolabrys sp.]HEV2629676.1 efflux RND transporter permease subunit [Pseudolabrys sp.]